MICIRSARRTLALSTALLLGAVALVGCSSITLPFLPQASPQPVSYEAPDGAFVVEFPGKPKETTEQTTVEGFDLETKVTALEQGDGNFAVSVTSFKDAFEAGGLVGELPTDVVDEILVGSLEGAAAEVEEGKLVRHNFTTVDGIRAIKGVITGKDDVELTAIVVMNHLVQYTILAGSGDSDKRKAFVESFHFTTAG